MRPQLILLAFATLFIGACATAPQQTAATSTPVLSPTAPKMSTADIEKAVLQIEKDGTVAMMKDDVSFIERVKPTTGCGRWRMV